MDLTFDVATAVVTTDLTMCLIGVPVRWTVPNPAPATFITVQRTGSAEAPVWADRAAFDVACWAGQAGDSPKAAEQLAAQVKKALLGLPGRDNRASTVRLTGEASLPDPVTGRPRMIVGATVTLRPH